MSIISAGLGNSPSSILSVPNGQQYAITSMFFCNYSDDDSTLNLYIVAAASSISDLNCKIIHDLKITPGDTFILDTEKIILDQGDKIFGQCSGSLACTISYVRVA
jgi:hypothetical protein